MHRDLIVFGEDWGGLPSSTQHLIRRLCHNRKVIWVNSIGLRRPRLQWRDITRMAKKILAKKIMTKKSSLNNVTQDTKQHKLLRIVSPLTLPAPRSVIERKLAAKMLSKQLLPIIQQEQLKAPILWTSLPTAVDMIGQLGESASVYYCGDDFNALAGVDHTVVAERERELAEKADLIITASQRLQERFHDKPVQLLPHGVDYHLFSQAAKRAKDLPNDGRSIAGFYGSISEWLNIELMTATARRLPHWHFVFIGKAEVDITSLKALNNITFLGPKPHHELPTYSQHWDVSLLPFRNNAQIKACNPLKLLEYMAAGKPIISTPFPALTPYKKFIDCVENSDDMVAALQSIQKTTLYISPSKKTAQQKKAKSLDWDRQANKLAMWLDTL